MHLPVRCFHRIGRRSVRLDLTTLSVCIDTPVIVLVSVQREHENEFAQVNVSSFGNVSARVLAVGNLITIFFRHDPGVRVSCAVGIHEHLAAQKIRGNDGQYENRTH